MRSIATGLIWLPTTGEFGTNGSFGDFDTHEKMATRLAVHYSSSDEDCHGQPNTDAFENVQIRLADGNPIFTPSLFGSGVQVGNATCRMFSTDGGVNFRGFSLEGECSWRRVDDLRGAGTETLAFTELNNHGFQLQASGMVMPQELQACAGLSEISGEHWNPWDLRLGANWYPANNRVLRWNTEYLHTNRSPVGGTSLPTTVGGTGDIFYSRFQVNFWTTFLSPGDAPASGVSPCPQVPEARLVAEHLLVEPAVDDRPAEAPFLSQLGCGDALLLRPLVDRLRLKPQVLRHLLEGEDLVIGRRDPFAHRRVAPRLSATDGRVVSIMPRTSRLPAGAAAGVPLPCASFSSE